ncbi:hypothetical protein [Limnothrix redekei]|uniref:Uncharacterized protein n=1 Tax=Limnothrix redekei LRLZ20PSL1 TaxID=3112953 RepID=A0ABW7CAS1_9CYAN
MMVDLFWGCQMGDVPKMAGLGRVQGGEMGPARSGIGLDSWGDREGANPIVNIGLPGVTPARRWGGVVQEIRKGRGRSIGPAKAAQDDRPQSFAS